MSPSILNVLRFLSLVCVALPMSAGIAHVLELPHKMSFSGGEYLVVQQIYRGWSLLGIPAVSALVLTGLVAILLRGQRTPFRLTILAEACLALSLAVFFAFTLPVNKQTSNWTMLPGNWEALRQVWEYSHATGAVLSFAAFLCLVAALMAGRAGKWQAAVFR
jgi:hypothetical protein